MGKLDGKVALITGGSEGIGFATADEFLREGAFVFITGRRQEVLETAVKQLGEKNIIGIQADSSKLTDIDKIIQVIKNEKGKLDILFANAGLSDLSPLGSITEEFFDNIFNINVKGILFTVQKALPIFSDGGSIILCGSTATIRAFPALSIYSASKAAVRSFARCWSVDLKDRKIRVNCLSPGTTDTPLVGRVATEEQKKALASTTVMNRLGQPSEIAKGALFLASDDSSYVTGIELFIDGGQAQI